MPFPRRAARTSSRLGIIAALGIIAIGLSGCAGTVSLRPAEASNDPACAEVMVRLPQQLDGVNGETLEKRVTDAQATAAWGTPNAAVIFRCGVTPPGPTTLDCFTSSTNVDWVIDPTGEGDDRTYLATTFGREPAIDVFIMLSRSDPKTVLDEISLKIYEHIPATATCTERPAA